MALTPSTYKTMVILDFRREVRALRNVIDRFSLPSELILKPAVLYAFNNLHLRNTGVMLTTFFFAAGDLTEELLIPRVDNVDHYYQMSDVEVEKQKQQLFVMVQVLGQTIEHHLRINRIAVPEYPDDVISAHLRGESLYVVYIQRTVPIFTAQNGDRGSPIV